MQIQTSHNTLEKESQKQLPVIFSKELSGTPEVYIPKEINQKIVQLCRRIHKVEWSGVIFYKTKGNFKDPDKMVFTILDLFPMDKGTAASTGFESDSRLIKYMMDHPDLCELNRGLIHSHCNFGSFFSITDDSELKENSEFNNYYLSVIVNNEGDFVAKVAFRGEYLEKITLNLKYRNEEGNYVSSNKKEEKKEDRVVFMMECNVKDNFTVDPEFDKLINEIIKKNEEETLAKKNANIINKPIIKGFTENKTINKTSYTTSMELENFMSKLFTLDNNASGSITSTLRALDLSFEKDLDNSSKEFFLDLVEENIETFIFNTFGIIDEEDVYELIGRCINILGTYTHYNISQDLIDMFVTYEIESNLTTV